MKRISILLFSILASFTALSQNYTETRQLRFFQITKASDTAETVGNRGRAWYDFVTNRFRCNVNGVNQFWGEDTGGGGAFWPLSGVGSFSGNVQIDGTFFDLDMSFMDNFTINPSLTFSVDVVAGNATIQASDDILLRSVSGDAQLNTSNENVELDGTGNLNISSSATISLASENLVQITTNAGSGAAIDMNASGISLTSDNSSIYNQDQTNGFSVDNTSIQIVTAGGDNININSDGFTNISAEDGSIFETGTAGLQIAAPNTGATIAELNVTPTGITSLTVGQPISFTSGTQMTLQAASSVNVTSTSGDINLSADAFANMSAQDGSIIETGTAGLQIAAPNAGSTVAELNVTPTGINAFTLAQDISFTSGDDATYSASDLMAISGTTSATLASGSNLIRADASGLDIEFDGAGDFIQISQPVGGTSITSIFEGEIQIDDVTGSDEITINDEGIQFSGTTSPPQIINATSSTSVVMLDNVVYTNTATSGNVGTGNTTIYTFSLPASTLFTTGQALVIEVWFEIANNTNVKSVSITVGGTQVASTGTLNVATQDIGKMTAIVTRTGATTALSANEYITMGTSKFSGTNDLDFTSGASITWGNANTVNIVAASATASNDIIGFYAKAYFVAQ